MWAVEVWAAALLVGVGRAAVATETGVAEVAVKVKAALVRAVEAR